MKIINWALKILAVAGKALLVILRFTGIFIYTVIARKQSSRRFKKELRSLGLPPEVVDNLNRYYVHLVDLNPFSYR